MNCPHCQEEMNDQTASCEKCGYDADAAGHQEPETAVISDTYCSNCGSKIDSGTYCSNCGCQAGKEAKTVVVNTTNLLILSVFNTLCCCLPLGLVALVLTLLASSSKTQEDADKKIMYATYLNYASIVFGILAYALYFAVGFLSVMSA